VIVWHTLASLGNTVFLLPVYHYKAEAKLDCIKRQIDKLPNKSLVGLILC